jgi:hypothetical protein
MSPLVWRLPHQGHRAIRGRGSKASIIQKPSIASLYPPTLLLYRSLSTASVSAIPLLISLVLDPRSGLEWNTLTTHRHCNSRQTAGRVSGAWLPIMLASVQTYPLVTMSLDSSPRSSSPPKRPRLSLQIKAPAIPQTLGKSTSALKGDIDPTSPTAFNTLSNAYAAAIENASPRTANPKLLDTKLKPTSLRLETSNFSGDKSYIHPSQRTQTPGPFSITYPDTPLSAFPGQTTATTLPDGDPKLPATATATAFTFTPPQSAGSDHQAQPKVFTFAAQSPNRSVPSTPRTPRRRMTIGNSSLAAPYTHPRALHSILRNSPLPPRSSVTPATPSRVSMRLAAKANKKVGYNDPLEQTITTNKYVKSHIDLLAEDSPFSAEQEADPQTTQTLEFAMTYTGDETRDGGQTPGPFEEMRRKMAESGLDTPGSRKRKRREKKRKWEWTINTTEMDGDDEGKTPLTAVRRTPITAVRRGASVSEGSETEMSEAEPRFVPSEAEDTEMSEADEGSVQSEPTRPSTSL